MFRNNIFEPLNSTEKHFFVVNSIQDKLARMEHAISWPAKALICKQHECLFILPHLKSASTDALKKCASEIGIASDIYNKEDFKEVQVETEKHTFEQLKKLYELKKDYILSKDLVHIKRVIDKEETQSYNKTFNFLNKL